MLIVLFLWDFLASIQSAALAYPPLVFYSSFVNNYQGLLLQNIAKSLLVIIQLQSLFLRVVLLTTG